MTGVQKLEPVLAAAMVAAGAAKKGRGGRRANQKGRPRKHVDPVHRSLVIESALNTRLEALASRAGRSPADIWRAALARGVELLELEEEALARGVEILEREDAARPER